ncbi:MAG: AraC family transcriptional regulator [Bacteroidetes bacterium]|nr:MAG: AraC family transcriptional regulator [Bacteroidota bacterium]
MVTPRTDPPRGVLHTAAVPPPGALARYLPSDPALAGIVEHYWSLRWSVPEPLQREVLAHPSVHVTVEAGRSAVHGVVTKRFVRVIDGSGWVFGIKFRPGAFRPFIAAPVSSLNDRQVPLSELFGADGTAYESDVLAMEADEEKVHRAERFLLERLPAADPSAALAAELAAAVAEDRSLMRVEELAARFGMSVRTVQRLCSSCIGVSPKWLIKRYRLHDAVEAMNRGGRVDLSQLALQLGYFDQAHFNNEFRSLTGRSPGEYLRTAG